MRIFLILALVMGSIISTTYAETTTTPNGVKISIETPSGLDPMIAQAVQARIDKFLE
jgi:sirohydrochlorin ferrochelatase